MDLGTILFYLIVGTVVGLLGKFVAPGNRDNIPFWLTIICGIGGMWLGDVIYRAFGGDGSRGLDWIQGLVTVLTAAVLVMLAATVTGRSRAKA
ncbi:GlsB/YeaQ/YmgE family stress response membrane protein [Nocardioides sp. GXQ0305]|uniref:GlsB/YeaQ/YmgE family stress response membrane protein n=1 Tax=Nocardioides sp. GXQ0305 TaxID=3423912 RepID=UPI003D7D3085